MNETSVPKINPVVQIAASTINFGSHFRLERELQVKITGATTRPAIAFGTHQMNIDDIIKKWAGQTFDESLPKENGLRRLARTAYLAGLEAAKGKCEEQKNYKGHVLPGANQASKAITQLITEAKQ